MRAIAVDIFLVFVGASSLFTVAALLLIDDLYERLHYLAVPATVGVIALVAAVFAAEGFSNGTLKTFLTAAFIFIMNPILTHATARAARFHEKGQWFPTPDEKVEVVGTDRHAGERR